jgi:putative flippase GtrA
MKKSRAFVGYLYRHHFVRYLFVGGTTFILDFATLFVLHVHLLVPIALATTIAYWSSILYNFFLNRWWTFSKFEKESLHRHALLYGSLLGFNYLFTVIFVSLVSHYIYFGLAKILAVPIQMTWTYIIYKKVIFK